MRDFECLKTLLIVVLPSVFFVLGCHHAIKNTPDLSNANNSLPIPTITLAVEDKMAKAEFELSVRNLEDNIEFHMNTGRSSYRSFDFEKGDANLDFYGRSPLRTAHKPAFSFKESLSISKDYDIAIEQFADQFLQKTKIELRRTFQGNNKHLAMIDAKLRDRGLPKVLRYIPFLESRYKEKSYSPTRNAGLWQMTPEAGRKFGLKINDIIDERIDAEKSTDAALDNLEYLYGKLDCWLLAIAAYNAGEGRILGALESSNRKDFWSLIDFKCIPETTQEYVLSILALDSIVDEINDSQ